MPIVQLENEIERLADVKISDTLNFLYEERQRVGRLIEVSGRTKKNFLGAETGILLTNKKGVDEYVSRLDVAIGKTKALLLAPDDNTTEALTQVRSEIGVPDLRVEEIELKDSAGTLLVKSLPLA